MAETKVTYLCVVRLLLLCWKAFSENAIPHQQHRVSSVCVLPSNQLSVIGGAATPEKSLMYSAAALPPSLTTQR